MRGLPLALLCAPLVLGATAATGEPLFLHIRPNDAPPADTVGPAGRTSDGEAAAARAAREAVWERSDRRARIAIASVCTGCLKPLPTSEAAKPAPPAALEPARAGAVHADTAPVESVLSLAATQATP